MDKELAEKNKILEIRTGSHLYGTSIPTSDEDYAGIFIAPIEFYLGLNKIEEIDCSTVSKQENGKNDEDAIDRKFYEFRKFVRLAVDANPNILEMVYANQENILFQNEIGKDLYANRDMFLSKAIVQKYLGFAFSQKHKMIVKLDNYQDLHAFNNKFGEMDHAEAKKMYVMEMNEPLIGKGKDYYFVGDLNFQKHITLNQVIDKVKARIEKVGNREELILKNGYDTKFCMHYVRLMYEGKELLETGNLVFPLKNADFLRDIRNGAFTMAEMIKFGEDFEKEIEGLKETTKLPTNANFKRVEEYLINTLRKQFGLPHG